MCSGDAFIRGEFESSGCSTTKDARGTQADTQGIDLSQQKMHFIRTDVPSEWSDRKHDQAVRLLQRRPFLHFPQSLRTEQHNTTPRAGRCDNMNGRHPEIVPYRYLIPSATPFLYFRFH